MKKAERGLHSPPGPHEDSQVWCHRLTTVSPPQQAMRFHSGRCTGHRQVVRHTHTRNIMISVAKSGSKSPRKSRKDRCHICGKDHPFWLNEGKQGFWYLSISDTTKANGYRQERLSKDHDEAERMWHQLSAGLPVTTTNRTTLSVATTSTAERSIISAPTYGETMLVGELVGMFLENKKPGETHLEGKKSKSSKMSKERYDITKGWLRQRHRSIPMGSGEPIFKRFRFWLFLRHDLRNGNVRIRRNPNVWRPRTVGSEWIGRLFGHRRLLGNRIRRDDGKWFFVGNVRLYLRP